MGRLLSVCLIAACVICASANAPAQPLSSFHEDFESGLSNWVGKSAGAHQGVIVEDPLRPGNHVLTFTGLNGSGDVFSPPVSVNPSDAYQLVFEYLGDPSQGGAADNLGGFIGVCTTPNGGAWPLNQWWWGTDVRYYPYDILVDDGQWHTYSIPIYPRLGAVGREVRVMIEDWVSSGGVAGDAYFDNVRLEPKPRQVSIDIKPGSEENPVNTQSNGGIPVAILSADGFDATTVDGSTVVFAGASPSHGAGHLEDVDGDGDLDWLGHFRNTDIEPGDTEAGLTGMTDSGRRITGSDHVKTVGKAKKPALEPETLTFAATNYPNPFNPATTIRYALPEGAYTKLTVYNALGQVVRVLVDGNQGVGHHSVQWDGRDALGRDATSGVYIYRLQAGDRVMVGRMVLTR